MARRRIGDRGAAEPDGSDRTSQSESGSHSSPQAQDLEDWYTIEDVVKVMRLRSKRDFRGELRFNPEDVSRLGSSSGVDSEIVRVLSETANVHLAANQKMVELLPKGMNQFLDQVMKSNDRLMNRIEHLEEERTKMLDAIEKAKTSQQERDLEEFELKKQEERKDTALGVLVEQGPKLLEQFLIGSDVQKLLGTIDPMLLEVLGSEESPLTPDQREQVKSIAKRLQAKRRPELRAVPDSKPATGTSGGET